MHLILCLDPRDGMAFNGRRLSRDSVQLAEMLVLVGETPLYLSADSAKLLEPRPMNVRLTDTACGIPTGCYLFVERSALLPDAAEVERVILYRWGRTYPADEYAPCAAYSAGKQLVSRRSFAGSSHPEMIEEVYA